MLRPATPLTVLLFLAFVLLLLSVISTPIIKTIPLGSFEGADFGVFGFCKNSKCSGAKVGYSTDSRQALNDQDVDKDFKLPTNARSSLSSILIVHPIAAFLTLICLILAASAHLHSPSHSPRYLLALLILLLPTLLITLLAFLVDILLFVPHLAWGGWIVLASTILITASGVLTCAMRRTLVSRKARKQRIAENAEMNGENYYNNQSTVRAESPPPLNTNPTVPTVHGASESDHLPTFATFDAKSSGADDERIPLNTRTPSNRAPPSNGIRTEVSDDSSDRYVFSGRGAPGGMRGGRGGPFDGPKDQFGNLLPPSNAFGPVHPGGFRPEPSESGMVRQYTNETVNSQTSRGRGGGGYLPRGYGRGGPYGPGRGGPGMNGNARDVPNGAAVLGAGPGMMVGETGNIRQRLPPRYGNDDSPHRRGMPAPYTDESYSGLVAAPTYGRDPSAQGYGRRPSPGLSLASGGYGRQPSPGPPSAPGGYGRQPSPGLPSAPTAYGHVSRESSPGPGRQPYRVESPPPPMPELRSGENHVIGQAVEMDAYTGSPSHTPTLQRPMQDSDGDLNIQGPDGLERQQQQRQRESLTSVYSAEQPYVPPRAAWAAGPARNGTPPFNSSKPLSPIVASPIELPTHQSPNFRSQANGISHHHQKSADTYYEDVDPRFADPLPSQVPAPVPVTLVPGGNVSESSSQPLNYNPQTSSVDRHPSPSHIQPSHSYESIQEARSPTASDTSNFTSISQRGINPHWRPPPGVGTGGVPNRRPQQQREMVLQTNPDFELPSGGRGRGGRAPGMIPGIGHGNVGRYPPADI